MQYKWTVLTNTTLGGLMASINTTIVLISLPAIFRGLKVNPLAPNEIVLLLWILMGYSIVTATVLVSLGRVSDIYGRTRMYTIGFIIFTVGSVLLSVIPSGTGNFGVMAIIYFRIIQAAGGAFLMVNGAALLTDAFPISERGKALGINMMSFMVGSMIGLILGGILVNYDWHLIFIVNIPFAVAGTIWSMTKLKEVGKRVKVGIDVWGNVLLALGLIFLTLAMTYTLVPYDGSDMGWTNPFVIGGFVAGAALLAAFPFAEHHAKAPLFNLKLFGNRAFTAGNFSALFSSMSRGAIMFLVVIWLQGVYLPLHGIAYQYTPFWAGIYMLPMVAGFVIFGPIGGVLTDRFGARVFAALGAGMLGVSLFLLTLLPYNFNMIYFELILFLNGIGGGLFASPNTTAIMNSLPPTERGAGNGMRTTFNNIGQTVSLALFFTIAITVFTARLPSRLYTIVVNSGISTQIAGIISHIPPVGALFAAFLGINPVASVLSSYPSLSSAIPSQVLNQITGEQFFPMAISSPFIYGFRIAMYIAVSFAIISMVLALLMGKRYIHPDQ